MSNQGNGNSQPLMPEYVAKLEILLRADGAVTVNGPIANKMMCYGMMEAARDAIHDLHFKNELKPAPLVTKVDRMPPGFGK